MSNKYVEHVAAVLAGRGFSRVFRGQWEGMLCGNIRVAVQKRDKAWAVYCRKADKEEDGKLEYAIRAAEIDLRHEAAELLATADELEAIRNELEQRTKGRDGENER